MAIDNRRVLQNIRIPATKDNPVRRILTEENADEIQSMFSQERLDAFVQNGVLEGDWKSSAKGSNEKNNQKETEEKQAEKEVKGRK